jgi:hypothetical protein
VKLNFEELIKKPGSRTQVLETPDGDVTVGSVSSADILEWFDENADPVKKHFAGLRLLVKSFINPDGTRVGAGLSGQELVDVREAAVQALSGRDALENGKLVNACLILNGVKAKPKDATKNDSSETPSDVSLTDSPSPSEK